MKKSKKIFLRVLPIVMVLMVVFTTNIFAAGFGDFDADKINVTADTSTNTIKTVNRVWGVILTILQVAAIAAVVFAGVRYMFASADSKADIKKQMIWLVVGAILVFGASTVIGFLTGTFNAMTGQK